LSKRIDKTTTNKADAKIETGMKENKKRLQGAFRTPCKVHYKFRIDAFIISIRII
jgi:hypothetical protein